MRVFQSLVGADEDADALLAPAMALAKNEWLLSVLIMLSR